MAKKQIKDIFEQYEPFKALNFTKEEKTKWEPLAQKIFTDSLRLVLEDIIENNIRISSIRGWPRGRVVKFARSAAGGPVFRWFESWARTWHCSSNHAEAASHMPQLEGPTTKNIQLCTRGLWGEKGKK